MDVPYNLPDLCRETGLSCQDCVEGSSSNIASLCKGLQATGIGQIFVQLYPHKACSPMAEHFRISYERACRRSEEPIRRPAGSSGTGGTGISAVA